MVDDLILTIINNNGVNVTDSRDVAKMVGKSHNTLLRDIRLYINELDNSPKKDCTEVYSQKKDCTEVYSRNYFIESTYENSQNKIFPCFLVTQKGCEYIAHKMKGKKAAKFTNDEFGELRVLTINEEPMFLGKELVEKLGYKIDGTTSYSKYVKQYCDKEDYMKMNNSGLELFGISDSGRKGEYLVNESGMYSLILDSELPSAKNFKRWVTKEVLPSIRKHGAYIGENADENYVNNELRFGNKTTIKTFANADPAMVNKLYSEFKEYIDTEYKDNTNIRKARYSSVEKGLNRLLENISTNVNNIGLCYNVQALRYKVLSDTKILGNRINGGKRAGLTRKNKKLNKEINSLKSDIEALKPISFDDMVMVNNYAISKNDLNDATIDSKTGKPKLINTTEYKGWKWYFKNAMDEANIKQLFSHINWSKPVEISYAVTCHDNNDIGNFIDALQDVIQDYFNCDDKKFLVGTQLIVGIEPDKMKRKTWLYFRNVEESNLYVNNGGVA